MAAARAYIAVLLSISATATVALEASAGPTTALRCIHGGPATISAAVATGTNADSAWAVDAARRIGYPVTLPTAAQARASALRTSALLRSGHIVAAKMANDEGLKIAGYASFGSGMESLMTVLTQPVAHASYPTSVRAEGEARDESQPHDHTFGVDMEASSASLRKVIVRAQVAKRAMGEDYAKPSVRYYLLAHGFRDEVALPVATAQICALRLSKDAIAKLDTSARFMAMPDDAPAGGSQ